AGSSPVGIAARATTCGPVLGITPSSGPAKTSVRVDGTCFTVGEQVRVKYKTGLSPPSPGGIVLCSATVVSNATFSCTAKIPGRSTAGAPGPHTIVAKELTLHVKVRTTFTLT